jgi:peptidoglycan/LPS O-acetylase OafA/YrhL
MRVLVPAVAAAIAVVVGFVMLVLVHSDDLARTPWRPLGLILVALGAVGLMVSMISRAMEIRGSRSGGSSDG